ncbi:MAG TPA: pyridoxamine 5'-phosphate oxidase family protein [Methanomassiliicoccales archaeon]|nr:pyridoxamine 5'-phosphate oxidase family protein [Methanomassiliicoccales archaeon]
MVNMPEEVMKLINENPKAVKLLGTKSADGSVHVVPLGSIRAAGPNMIILGAILMHRTGANLESMKSKGELVSVVAVDGEKLAAFEVRAKVKDYQTAGPAFEGMNEVIKKMGLTLRGVWVLEPAEVWNQSASYNAGKKMV